MDMIYNMGTIYNTGTVYNTYIHREYNFSFSQFQVPMEGT